MLRGMLEPLGFLVEEAASGEEAIAKASSVVPRIILMDLVMPGMDGIETTRILRKNQGNREQGAGRSLPSPCSKLSNDHRHQRQRLRGRLAALYRRRG